jgi:hypothetical protein
MRTTLGDAEGEFQVIVAKSRRISSNPEIHTGNQRRYLRCQSSVAVTGNSAQKIRSRDRLMGFGCSGT